MNMETFFKFVSLLYFITFFEPAYGANELVSKIAVVDMEFILENSLAVNSTRKSINELSKRIEKEMNEQEIKYKKYQEQLLELQKTITKEKFNLLVLEFNKSVNNFQKDIQQKKMALGRAHSQAMEIVLQKSVSIIANLAKKYNFDIVLPFSQVFYIRSEFNITSEVILNLNANLKVVPINYKTFLRNCIKISS